MKMYYVTSLNTQEEMRERDLNRFLHDIGAGDKFARVSVYHVGPAGNRIYMSRNEVISRAHKGAKKGLSDNRLIKKANNWVARNPSQAVVLTGVVFAVAHFAISKIFED